MLEGFCHPARSRRKSRGLPLKTLLPLRLFLLRRLNLFGRLGLLDGLVCDGRQGQKLGGRETLRIYLKYPDAKSTVITDIQRVSKPGRRVYVKGEKIPKVLNGYGTAILSTSKGIMTDKEAKELNIGGEILCNVW